MRIAGLLVSVAFLVVGTQTGQNAAPGTVTNLAAPKLVAHATRTPHTVTPDARADISARAVEAGARATVDNTTVIDVNQLSMYVTNTGSFAWNGARKSGLEFPKGTGKTAVYAAGLWLGGASAADADVRVEASTSTARARWWAELR
jgi:hypothetical protein